MSKSYHDFLDNKGFRRQSFGFEPIFLPDCLFPFQRHLVEWAIRAGRCAIFADCGLGKTLQQLVWAENIYRKTDKRVLIVTPLAVAPQTIREGAKFGIDVKRSKNGSPHKGITVTNYQRLRIFNPRDYVAVVCDESSILKNFDGKTRRLVTEFLARVEYRLLCTATPAPNDYMELGTSSEALGYMGRNQMLGMFFTNDGETTQQWRLKGHAKKRFWVWMASWARAVRKPSDLGYEDGDFQLPPLDLKTHVTKSRVKAGFFPQLARSLSDQRVEKKETIRERCSKVAEIIPGKKPCLVWCQLNAEGDLLAKLIPGAVQVKGSDPDDVKEERLNAFSTGQIRVLVTKPSIACFGMNWQHCADMSYFPSHSHEQYYQAVRRCWRFGQEKKVSCHLVYSEAEAGVASNMLRKERQSDEMYNGILREMNNVIEKKQEDEGTPTSLEIPSWL